jgi:DNA adenine methylase
MAPAPLLKWPGGKGGELPVIAKAMPTEFDRYFEPFLGGGAVFWSIPPSTPAFVNDACVDLAAFYRCVQLRDEAFLALLSAIDNWWRNIERFVESNAGPLVESFASLRRRDSSVALVEVPRRLIVGSLREVADTVPAEWVELRDQFAEFVAALVPKKLARMRKLELHHAKSLPVGDIWSNIEGAYKASCYTALRAAYNESRRLDEASPKQAARFFFLREHAYAAMFRFNSDGEFNVPYGGIGYNRKNFSAKIAHLHSEVVRSRMETTIFDCRDFVDFLDLHQPDQNDFMFLDPPYDSDFSSYDDTTFQITDHQRLADVMRVVPCRIQLIIKDSPAVRSLYSDSSWRVSAFDKTYLWTIKERNDRRATHLMITNYEEPG